MHRMMTQDDLVKRTDITEKDKILVEVLVGNQLGTGETPECTLARAVRGYLVRLMDEDAGLTANLREQLGGDAAAFDDGWTAAFDEISLVSDALNSSIKELETAAAQLHSYRLAPLFAYAELSEMRELAFNRLQAIWLERYPKGLSGEELKKARDKFFGANPAAVAVGPAAVEHEILALILHRIQMFEERFKKSKITGK